MSAAQSPGAAAPHNPYKAWIDTYADEHFGEAVRPSSPSPIVRPSNHDVGDT